MDLQSGLLLGRLRGIAIRVHWSWVFIFTLVAWSLATGIFPDLVPGWSPQARWAAALAAALVFFLSVLLHELSHAFVAQRYGMSVPSITLFIFGGVSNIDGEMQSAGQEFRVAIAGPAMSLLLGLVFTAVGFAVPGDGAQVLFYLGFVNFALGVFNLLPGFPLDGGRVFRSIVWARTHDLARATKIAARVGIGIAWALIVLGIMTVLVAGIVGLWYVLIGLFLKSASESAYGQLVLERTLQGVRVRDVMRPPPDPVDAGTSLAQLIEERVLARGERALFVGRDGGVAGLLTTTDLARVPRDRHATTTAAEAMVPAEQVVTVEPQSPLLDAMRLMVQRDVHQLPVVEGGRMVGLLSRGDVIQQLEARERLGQPPARSERR